MAFKKDDIPVILYLRHGFFDVNRYVKFACLPSLHAVILDIKIAVR